ncbi:MAG: PaaI family thioesterase [Chloroflexota bacterium]
MTSDATVALADIRVGGRRIVLTPHNCFACGSLNVHGLHLDLHAGGDRCWTELTLGERFEGWEGIAHGGIVCTILDEVMAWALVDHDVWGVTARMNVEFRRPVRIGRPIRAEGRVLEVRRRLVTAEGVVLDGADGTLLARAEGTFVGAPEARKEELKARYRFRLEPDAPAQPPAPSSDGAGIGETPDTVDHHR